MIDQGVDIAFSEAPGIDHSFMIPLGLINPDDAIPIVPITMNCNTPPRPTFGRSREIGQALGTAIAAAGPGRAVLVGTGGLSHWVGSEERRAFQNRRPGDRIAERGNYPLELPEEGPINEPFDREFLEAYGTGQMAAFSARWLASPRAVLPANFFSIQSVECWVGRPYIQETRPRAKRFLQRAASRELMPSIPSVARTVIEVIGTRNIW